jgi:TPP-dependent pyruvate/acetoin dehydrogenase alpha subunit
LISWKHGFPQDAKSYRSHQRRKDEEAERLRKLEEAVHRSLDREKDLEAKMQEEVKRQVELALSSQRQSTSELTVNISPLS